MRHFPVCQTVPEPQDAAADPRLDRPEWLLQRGSNLRMRESAKERELDGPPHQVGQGIHRRAEIRGLIPPRRLKRLGYAFGLGGLGKIWEFGEQLEPPFPGAERSIDRKRVIVTAQLNGLPAVSS